MKIILSVYTTLLAVLCLPLLFCCKKEVSDTSKVKDPPVSTAEIIFNPNLNYGSVTDQSGFTYKTITIGTQTWMAENLRTTKYRNRVAIPEVADDNAWSPLITGAWCNYQNDTTYTKIYGRLYNWYAVNDSRNIAPAGWHLPTDAEWQILISYLDEAADFSHDWGVCSTLAGAMLKEMGTTHWFSPNTASTNESGFTALPGGGRDAFSGFDLDKAGKNGAWWSNSAGFYGSIYYQLSTSNKAVYRGQYPYTSGYSVRCVKD
jgi:uncharacterized protein (TIGR02145 family)